MTFTPRANGPMPRTVKRWPEGPPFGRVNLDLVEGGFEGDMHDRWTGELFTIKRNVDCGLGCKCAAEATWVPGHNLNGEVGDWVRSVHFGPSEVIDDNDTVPPGTLGQVRYVDHSGTRHTDWENGSRLGTVLGIDQVKVVLPAKPCLVCGVPCAAYDPHDPESYVHYADGSGGDHTAEVTP